MFLSPPKILGVAYSVIASLAVMLSALMTPISMVPDEPNHFLRALQFYNGQIVSVKKGALSSGGFFHEGTLHSILALDDIKYHAERSVSPEMAVESHKYGGDGPIVFAELNNTAMNPPWAYPGVIAGIFAGKALDVSLWHTVLISRILTGLFAVSITSLAIFLCLRGVLFLTVVASLPMTLYLFGSCSQDAMVIACSLLIASLLSRLRPSQRPSWPLVVFSCLSLIVISVKPPMILFCLMPLLLQRFRNVKRWVVGLSGAMMVIVGWLLTGFRWGKPDFSKFSDGALNEHFTQMIHHPLEFLAIFPATLKSQFFPYCKEFIGVLGWLDSPMPTLIYVISSSALLLALLPLVAIRLRHVTLYQVVMPSLLITAACLGVLTSLYVLWTPVENATILGVQGRYFIPISAFLILIMPLDQELAGQHFLEYRLGTRLMPIYIVTSVLFLLWTLHARYWVGS